jgi:simple sugar transport system substrate-binding protein
LACALALVLVVTGCDNGGGNGKGGKGTKVITVGFAQTGAESGWRTANTRSFQKAAKDLGIDLKFSDAQGRQENQIKAIRSFIAQGVDAIVLAPLVETGWEPVMKEARAAKIPLFLSDRRIKVEDDSLYVCFIGSDFVEEGRLAARWLVKKVKGKARIVELQGTPGAAPAIDRQKGFMEVIKAHPEMKIIASQSGYFRRSKGKEVMEAFLKKYGDQVDVLYAHNDDMALGAIQAIEDAGKKPGTDIVIVSVDALKTAFEAMVAGKLNCTVECNPLLGPKVLKTVQKVLAGETVQKTLYMKDEVFDRSTAKDVIDSRQY